MLIDLTKREINLIRGALEHEVIDKPTMGLIKINERAELYIKFMRMEDE